MKPWIRWIISSLLGIFSLYLIAVLLMNMGSFQTLYAGWSARYHTPIEAQKASEVKRYCAQNSEEVEGIWPVFWTEVTQRTVADNRSSDALCLLYDGDGSVIWPVSFKAGGYPGEMDQNSCAISTQLSWALWGSIETMGKEFKINGRSLVVCGVYESEEATAILKGDDTVKWSGIEWLSQESVTRETLIGYLESMGLSKPDTLVDGKGLSALVTLISWLPISLAGIITLVSFLVVIKSYINPVMIKWIILGALLVFALCLPWLLTMLPSWLLPTKWSDFSFWINLSEQMGEYVQEWISMHPAAKDVLAKQLLLAQSVLIIIAVISLALFYRQAGTVKAKNKEIYTLARVK